MKTVNLVVGLVLIVIALGSLGGAAVVATGTCAANTFTQALTGYPLCSTLTTEAAILGGLGVVFLIIAIVLLVMGRSETAPAPLGMTGAYPPPPPPPPAPAAPPRVCLGCGTMLPSPAPKFCPSCGKAVPS